ncbi:MAG: hypothetical protein LBJ86_00270 [Spirochaetaceae bacterium]|jgi:predicted outer membrane repeat protein|nr:hypothetical protein [Spirochaetaceae bacterium]
MKKNYALIVCMTVCGAALFAQTAATIYVGDPPQGGAGTYDEVLRDLFDAADWLKEYARDGGNYTIVLGKDHAANGVSLDYGSKKVAVTLKATGGTRTITRNGSTLFTVGAGVTLTLEEGVILSGAGAGNGYSLVRIEGGTFTMNGGAISGNTVLIAYYVGRGSGVYVDSGTFTMNGGTISGNAAHGKETYQGGEGGEGGGVYVDNSGTFTMNGGTISGNTADRGRGDTGGSGGGVYAVGFTGGGVFVGGTFTMSSGIISGNTADLDGGGVCGFGTFTMSGGAISGNTVNKDGGGVYVYNGTVTMNGGAIGGNTAKENGGGVYMDNNGTFTKSDSGGIIYGSNAPAEMANKAGSDEKGHAAFVDSNTRTYVRNTTADETTALDSTKNRIQGGGWE